ncbi:MAG: hypothetical protein HY203_04325 [Nitrospirae bacterium]|nr:hypothetical protein [Nitrospirota bacterium]
MHKTSFIEALRIGALSIILSSCVSTQSVVDKLGSLYIGKNFDEFVLNRGVPQKKFVLSNGDVAYVWNSGTSSVAMPVTANTTGYGNTAKTTVSGGGSIDMFCEVQFVTSPAGIIKQVSILKDTIGFWTTSMCHEVFDK